MSKTSIIIGTLIALLLLLALVIFLIVNASDKQNGNESNAYLVEVTFISNEKSILH